jgi:hypothetical protein
MISLNLEGVTPKYANLLVPHRPIGVTRRVFIDDSRIPDTCRSIV